MRITGFVLQKRNKRRKKVLEKNKGIEKQRSLLFLFTMPIADTTWILLYKSVDDLMLMCVYE